MVLEALWRPYFRLHDLNVREYLLGDLPHRLSGREGPPGIDLLELEVGEVLRSVVERYI
jgi:hypothetical protein